MNPCARFCLGCLLCGPLFIQRSGKALINYDSALIQNPITAISPVQAIIDFSTGKNRVSLILDISDSHFDLLINFFSFI